jgi:outer membrane protein, heavy metal efflux system
MRLAFIAICILTPLTAAAQENSTVAELEGVITLQDVVTAVLAGSPGLLAGGLDLKAAEAQRLHAGQGHNPEIAVEIEDAGGTGAFRGIEQAQTTLQLSQLFELGGKSAARRSVAASAEQRAQRDLDLHRADMLTEAAARFIHVVGDQHRLALAREAKELAQAALTVAQRLAGVNDIHPSTSTTLPHRASCLTSSLPS